MKNQVGCGTIIVAFIAFAIAVAFLRTFWWLLIAVGIGILIYQKRRKPTNIDKKQETKIEFSQVCPACGATNTITEPVVSLKCAYCGTIYHVDEKIKKDLETVHKNRKDNNTEVDLKAIAALFLVLGAIGLFFYITGFGESKTEDLESQKRNQVQVEEVQDAANATKSGLAGDDVIKDNAETDNIKSIEVFETEDVQIKVGEDASGRVKVDVLNIMDFAPEDVQFISDNPNIATIAFTEQSWSGTDLYYRIKAVNPGETTVYASSLNGKITSERIKVIVSTPIVVENISIDDEIQDLVLGESTSLTAVVAPENAEDKSVIWASSDENVLVVDQEGMVTAVGAGTATITVTSVNNISASKDINVDGTKRMMSLRVTHTRDDDVNIGNEWSYHSEINGENAGGDFAVAVGDTLYCYAVFTEEDDNPDVGEASTTYTVTEEDITNGFTIPMDLYVTENSGRNSGKSAHFIVTYMFRID